MIMIATFHLSLTTDGACRQGADWYVDGSIIARDAVRVTGTRPHWLVLGARLPEELGITLPHEHLLLDFTKAMRKPEYNPCCMENLQFTMRNLGKIRQFP